MGSVVKSLLLLFCLLPACQSYAQNVDLKIVLALDASGSVEPSELALQIDGIANAFRDGAVQDAILSGPTQSISAAVLVWSDAANPKYAGKWHTLHTPQSFEVFAREIEDFKALGGGGTSIGDALAFAITMLEENPARAPRWVVDISGDGPETPPVFKGVIELPTARLIAEQRMIIVNGLAIETDIPDLQQYYRDNVITGPGSFAISAQDYHDYQRAIIDKLLRELPTPPLAFNDWKTRKTVARLPLQ